jgi:hypothetical protein
VVDVAVHIAVGEQADEVNDAAPGLGAGDDLLPGLALPDGAGSAMALATSAAPWL